MKEEKNIKKILQSFCSDDELRPWMNYPFSANGKIIATDGYQLIHAGADNVGVDYEESCNNWDKVKGLMRESNMNFEINVSHIAKLIDSIPKIDDFDIIGDDKECEACNGEGEVDAEFYHNGWYYDVTGICPICDGDGLLEKERKAPNGKKIIDFEAVCKIKNSQFSVSRLNKIIELAIFLSWDVIRLVYQNRDNEMSIFRVGNFDILFMPMPSPGKENSFEIK